MSQTAITQISDLTDVSVEEMNLTKQTVTRPINIPHNSHYLNSDFMLIWVDTKIDSSADCQHAKILLQQLVNKFRTFVNLDACLAFLEAIANENYQQQICVIVSGSLSYSLIPIIKNMNIVTAIAIYCFRAENHEADVDIVQHPKVIGLYVKLGQLLVALDTRIQSLATVTTLKLDSSNHYQCSIKDLSQENPTFVWFHLLIQSILLLPRSDAARSKMLAECDRQYDDNAVEQNKINEFRHNYRPDQAVKWYTRDSFVYRLVNRALRTQDIDEILVFYPFIADLHDQLRVLHDEFLNMDPPDELTVYRGQLIHINELRKITDNVGGLLSMNSFFSTGFKRSLARHYAGESNTIPPDLVSLVYEVKIDTNVRAAPFSNVGEHTYFPSEEEFLFSVDAIFRIQVVAELNDEFGQYWQVQLRLIDERNEQELTGFLDQCKSEIGNTSSLASLASVLCTMGDYVHGERYCHLLLNELPVGQTDRLVALTILGHIAQETGRQQEAYIHYEQALSECEPTNTNQKLLMLMPFSNVATMHFEAGHYDIAANEFLQLLKLRETYFSSEHRMLIYTHNNLAICLMAKGNLNDALEHLERAFMICKKQLPENDPTRASVEGNLGDIYYKLGLQRKAIMHYENALTIQKRCVPSGHRFLIAPHRNLGYVYIDTADYGKALAHLESALTIEEHQNSIDPLSLVATLNGLGCVYSGQGRISDAQSYLERAVALIPENHPAHVGTLQRLASVLGQMGKIAAAHDTLRQAIAIHEQQKDKSNELELALIFHSMGSLYCQSGEQDQALEAYKKALTIRQRLLPPVHPDTARLYNEIGGVYLENKDYVQALNYFQQARAMELETLPEGHLESARTQHKIGYTLFEMGKIAEAEVEETKALSIMLGKQQLYANHPLLNSIRKTLNVIHTTISTTNQTPSNVQQKHN
jgi:tetratricopeptide (TPR) repeat protein